MLLVWLADAIGALLVDKQIYPKPSKLEDITANSNEVKTNCYCGNG